MTYARPQYLVETDWLAENLEDLNLRIYDCTMHLIPHSEKVFTVENGRADFETGHIPGAGYLDLQEDLSDSAGAFRFTTPDEDSFAKVLGFKGLGDDCRVVLYSTAAMSWATRVWWMLYAFGFDNAAVLNGGWQKWRAEARPVSTEPCDYVATNLTAQQQPDMIVGKDAVLTALAAEDAVVVNALTRPQHEGTSDVHYGRPGGIGGSICLPALDLLAEDNTFLDADALRMKFADAGIGLDKRIVTYCGGGIAATVDSFALALLGHDHVGVYDNSLSEWAKDPNLPMETSS